LEGTVAWFDPDKHHGRILGADEREYFFRESFLEASTTSEILTGGVGVEFVVSEHDVRGPQAHEVRVLAGSSSDEDQIQDAEHLEHCFVVMPFGRDGREARWFRGWYETVIQPAIVESGFNPILSASEKAPNAINDEIRAHLALDPMVIVDLGGITADDSPNPNVMYELGIRHALNLPLVMMGWEGQRLPFDISNQRVIMGRRELLDIEPTKDQLTSFIAAARDGQYYRPMEAVGRIATIDRATKSLGGESLLGVLAKEVRDMRRSLSRRPTYDGRTTRTSPTNKAVMKSLLRKEDRSKLYLAHVEAGGDTNSWSKLLQTQVATFGADDPRQWTFEDWNRAVVDVALAASREHMPKADEPEPTSKPELKMPVISDEIPDKSSSESLIPDDSEDQPVLSAPEPEAVDAQSS
jgi:cold shock CspA family protein